MRRRPLSYVRRMGVFFRQLHSLTKAGFPIGQACRQLERTAPRGLRGVTREMAAAAEAGRPVSSVMEKHRALFYPWHIGLISAAEAGGFLPEALDQIASGYEAEWETRSATLWPLVLYTCLAVPGIIITIPAIKLLSAPIPEQGWTPQSEVQMLLYYFRTISLPILLGLAAAAIVWFILGGAPWFQAWQQRMVVRLPLVGRVARGAALERYLSSLALLLRAGVSVGEAAEHAAMAAGNAALTPRLLAVVPSLRAGVTLTSALTGARLLDEDTLSMLATGETAGELPEMLSRAATYYREDNRNRRKTLIRMAQVGIVTVYASFAAILFFKMALAYFNFAFKVSDWVSE